MRFETTLRSKLVQSELIDKLIDLSFDVIEEKLHKTISKEHDNLTGEFSNFEAMNI